MIRLATVFSGIGAAEQALKQMGVEHEIVFACDNGERYFDYTKEQIDEIIAHAEAGGCDNCTKKDEQTENN